MNRTRREALVRLELGPLSSRTPAILYQPARPQPAKFMIAFLQQDKGNERPGLRECTGLEFARLADCSPTARQRERATKGATAYIRGNDFARMGPFEDSSSIARSVQIISPCRFIELGLEGSLKTTVRFDQEGIVESL